jgi:hypothetical protein
MEFAFVLTFILLAGLAHLLTAKIERSLNYFSGYMKTKSIHDRVKEINIKLLLSVIEFSAT